MLGFRNDQVLISGPEPGELVVVAGVQKMAPGLHVALTGNNPNTTVAITMSETTVLEAAR